MPTGCWLTAGAKNFYHSNENFLPDLILAAVACVSLQLLFHCRVALFFAYVYFWLPRFRIALVVVAVVVATPVVAVVAATPVVAAAVSGFHRLLLGMACCLHASLLAHTYTLTHRHTHTAYSDDVITQGCCCMAASSIFVFVLLFSWQHQPRQQQPAAGSQQTAGTRHKQRQRQRQLAASSFAFSQNFMLRSPNECPTRMRNAANA